MTFVLDASVAISWCLADEKGEATDAVMSRLGSGEARVPTLFWYEVQNVLLVAERRERLGPGEADAALAELRALPIQKASPSSDSTILDLARRHALTSYDAAYLALALDEGVPLATRDRLLAAAAAREAVVIIGG